MEVGSGEFAYIACAILIAVYAWDRFNTPSSNRSSTLRTLYWSSCGGYVVSALALFAGLSVLLEAPAWKKLFELGGQSSLPAPLIATLAMTTLLPSVPILKRVDGWLLSMFLEWGAIPAEARRCAEAMTPASFTVTGADVMRLRKSDDGGYGDTFTRHLRDEGSSGLKRSEYRFTRVVKLYEQIHRLAADPRYRRFFAEISDEFAALERQIESFLRCTVTKLDGAGRPSVFESDLGYQELMAEWHGRFADDCRNNFILLARFLARAVLRSEPCKAEIVARLREIGFTEMETGNAPEFPLNSLTILGLGIFGYLIVASVWFSYRSNTAPATGLMLAGKITLARVASIGMTVWLLQQFAFFRRETGDPPRYFAYLVNGILSGALAAGVCGLFRIGCDSLFTVEEARIAILSGILCTAIAFCCDNWTTDDSSPPLWRSSAEAIGCGFAMVVGTALLWCAGLAPETSKLSPGTLLATWIALPSAMAAMIGACVPHIYRASRSAAAARLASITSPRLPEPRLISIPRTSPQPVDKGCIADVTGGFTPHVTAPTSLRGGQPARRKTRKRHGGNADPLRQPHLGDDTGSRIRQM
jgi:hypothetical protein